MLDTPKALQESIARCTSIRSSLRSQRLILSGRREWKDVTRPCDQGGGRERRKSQHRLRLIIVGAFYQNVRHSSAFVLAEIQIEPHSVSVPLTSTE